jgi:chemotaxis protein methyltransferase CheR
METWEYSLVKREILSLTGVDLNAYKTQQMQRRLNAYLQRSNHSSWSDFFKSTRNNASEISKLKDYLTINVTSFFRDREKFGYLQKTILPELLRRRSQLRVWSAGCSRGHEPYSLAIILAEIAGYYRRHEILATDIDRATLEWAKAGGPYSSDEVANLPESLLRRYFRLGEGSYYVTEDLRRRVTFCEHNLLSGAFPASGNRHSASGANERGFDLIVCRNVVIYFTAEVKDRLYQFFYDALRPGGILFVGGTEIVSKASTIGFETAGISFYRRNGVGRVPTPSPFSRKGTIGGK